jgi:hypothetical protein
MKIAKYKNRTDYIRTRQEKKTVIENHGRLTAFGLM